MELISKPVSAYLFDLFLICLIGLAAMFVGFLISLPTLFVPGKWDARGYDHRLKISTHIRTVFVLLAFFVGFCSWLSVAVVMEYFFATWLNGYEYFQPYENAILVERWIQEAIPPPFRQPCYSRQEEVCKRARYVAEHRRTDAYVDYVQNVAIGMLSVIGNLVGVRLWMRLRQRAQPPVQDGRLAGDR